MKFEPVPETLPEPPPPGGVPEVDYFMSEDEFKALFRGPVMEGTSSLTPSHNLRTLLACQVEWLALTEQPPPEGRVHSCVWRNCTRAFTRRAARDAHMDEHFPPRYRCLNPLCPLPWLERHWPHYGCLVGHLFAHEGCMAAAEAHVRRHHPHARGLSTTLFARPTRPHWMVLPAILQLRLPDRDDTLYALVADARARSGERAAALGAAKDAQTQGAGSGG